MSETKELVQRAGELADAEKPDEAMVLVEQVLRVEPNNPGALFVGCCVLLAAARWVQAMQMALRITEVAPRDPRGWGMLALVHGELHDYDRSIAMAERALALRESAKTRSDAAYAHVNAGNWKTGREHAERALELAKGDPSKIAQSATRDASVAIAYCQLAAGEWREGFAAYRLTMRTKWRKEWTYGESKEWQGERDATVMVTGEQGLGDEIMAASVVPDAIDACQTFVFDCDHRLGALFRRSFPQAIITPTRREKQVVLPVAPTHHKSLFGLSELFRHQDADFPRRAYLVPNNSFVYMFKSLFELLPQPIIGIAWSGGLPRTGQEPRMAGLNAFLPLIRANPKATFISLQYKDDAAEITAFRQQYGFNVLSLPWVTQGQDIDLLAGLIAALDQVVGVHTTALHLSSALGVPTTVLTHRGSGWRYAPQELLWYPPTTRMHRKRGGESWRDLVARVELEPEEQAA